MSNETRQSSAMPGAAHLADDVTFGQVVRWIDREHIKAAKENPPNRDYMRAMQSIGAGVEGALRSYRMDNPKAALSTPCSLVSDALAWAESNGDFVDRKLESRLRDAGRWASAGENACEILAGYIRKIQANTQNEGPNPRQKP